MSDQRPRPQYGEYATPEEQRARIREPLPEVHIDSDVPVYASSPAPATGVPQAGAPTPGQAGKTQRTITIAMLAFGAVNVLMAAVSFLSFSDALTETFLAFGLERSVAEQPRPQIWGTTMLLVLVIGFLVTAYLCVRRIQAQKSSWWIALVGAVVTWVVVYAIMAAVIVSDPAFAALLELTADGTLTTP